MDACDSFLACESSETIQAWLVLFFWRFHMPSTIGSEPPTHISPFLFVSLIFLEIHSTTFQQPYRYSHFTKHQVTMSLAIRPRHGRKKRPRYVDKRRAAIMLQLLTILSRVVSWGISSLSGSVATLPLKNFTSTLIWPYNTPSSSAQL
jgi:hypothetical protein